MNTYSRAHRDGWSGHPPPYPRKRRGHGLTVLVVTLVVLIGAFAVIDQVARVYAQNTIAAKATSVGFGAQPSVSIKGWPFLTQVAGRDVRQIDLSAQNVRESTLNIASLNATADGVHLNSGYSSATIDTITGTGLITFSSLTGATGASGVTLSANPPGGPNSAKISAEGMSGTASVSVNGPSSISIRTESLGGIPAGALGRLPGYTVDVPHLPMGMTVTGVSVTSQGVSVQVSAHDTTLSGPGAS